jgi:hypothetical protein
VLLGAVGPCGRGAVATRQPALDAQKTVIADDQSMNDAWKKSGMEAG